VRSTAKRIVVISELLIQAFSFLVAGRRDRHVDPELALLHP
jgi:hypothetical protein